MKARLAILAAIAGLSLPGAMGAEGWSCSIVIAEMSDAARADLEKKLKSAPIEKAGDEVSAALGKTAVRAVGAISGEDGTKSELKSPLVVAIAGYFLPGGPGYSRGGLKEPFVVVELDGLEFDGKTLKLGNVSMPEGVNEFRNGEAKVFPLKGGAGLVAIIRMRFEAPPTVGSFTVPVGEPVAGKPGFVISPVSRSGPIDVRGLPSNTEVRDPHTGEIFLVP
jgi:hypothetical protein